MNTLNQIVLLKKEGATEFFEADNPWRLLIMVRGLRMPRSSLQYKIARADAQRLSAQGAALVLTFAVLCLALLIESDPVRPDRYYAVQWGAADTAPEPMPMEDAAAADPLPEVASAESFSSVAADAAARAIADAAAPLSDGASGIEATPAGIPVAALPEASITARPIRSLSGFKKIIGISRSVDLRPTLLVKGGGGDATEDAVLRALRWLKKNQQADGAWKSQKIAMTGLAVLTFLAHDERPAGSPEFGGAVQRALEFLMSSQKPDGHFSGADGNEYAHPIAAYALCEAYGMTLNPNVKAAAEKALGPIVKGQHPTGGWDYKMNPGVSAENGKYRDDTSYMGWCVQALKAAKLAQLHVDGLDKALKLAVRGFQKNANPNGGFGYTAPGQGGLTGVGTLCMQLLGAANEPEVRRSLVLMEAWRPSFEAVPMIGGSSQYYCYYATQAKFHAGGKSWAAWNREMTALYLKAQQVEKDAAKDADGHAVDVGWWVNGDAHTDRPVMDTCLAALQLMVYYRNLPTTGLAATQRSGEGLVAAADAGDLSVVIRDL